MSKFKYVFSFVFVWSLIYARGCSGPEDRYKLNELSTLNETLSREFICLTSTGLGLYTKNRPIDKLRSILSETNMETPALDNFCKQYMPDEFCAMCLAIACQSARPEAVVLYPAGGENALTLTATTMFFQKGGSPAMSLGTHAGFGNSFILFLSNIFKLNGSL